ncbi:MAG: penicillin-binding protein 2 [Patescibacteria group bacterium]|nr:penicillin-binding protein 2 [Patescibacteria group bacterium]
MKPALILRIRIITFFIFLFAVILIAKLYFIQIISSEIFIEKANHQYITPNQSIFDRGTIYFKNKDASNSVVATLKEGFTLAMVPRDIKDVNDAYLKISPLISLDKDIFLAKSQKKNDPYEELAKHVEIDVGNAIDALKIPGIKIYKDKWRFYPSGTSASHEVGFIGYNGGNKLTGQYGLERSYESVLGRDTENIYINFFAEIFAGLDRVILKGEPRGNIVTSLDPVIQDYIEKTIEKIGSNWNSEVTGIIVLNPMTGEINGMSSYPTFDPNSFQSEKNSSIFINPLIENVYEMGSIIKPLTISAGIDSGAITAKTTYNDRGFIELDGKKISNFDGIGRGIVSMQVVLNESLNTGAAFAVSQMGNDVFSRYMTDFGLGELTGVDLPNEAKGIITNLKSPRDIEHATASFGQGIAMTPVNTARAVASLANGGKLIRPHIVTDINYTLGYSKHISPEEQRTVIKKETSEEITRMLIEAVDTSLGGGRLKLQHYSIAAKTGTAQIPDPRGSYYDDRILHSFFGYFPAYNPRFLVFLFTKNPKGARFATETLVSPFIDIAKFLINYYEIPPDR